MKTHDIITLALVVSLTAVECVPAAEMLAPLSISELIEVKTQCSMYGAPDGIPADDGEEAVAMQIDQIRDVFISEQAIPAEQLEADVTSLVGFLEHPKRALRERAANAFGALFFSKRDISTGILERLTVNIMLLFIHPKRDAATGRLYQEAPYVFDALLAAERPIPAGVINGRAQELVALLDTGSDDAKKCAGHLLGGLFSKSRDIAPEVIDYASTVLMKLYEDEDDTTFRSETVFALTALLHSNRTVSLEVINHLSAISAANLEHPELQMRVDAAAILGAMISGKRAIAPDIESAYQARLPIIRHGPINDLKMEMDKAIDAALQDNGKELTVDEARQKETALNEHLSVLWRTACERNDYSVERSVEAIDHILSRCEARYDSCKNSLFREMIGRVVNDLLHHPPLNDLSLAGNTMWEDHRFIDILDKHINLLVKICAPFAKRTLMHMMEVAERSATGSVIMYQNLRTGAMFPPMEDEMKILLMDLGYPVTEITEGELEAIAASPDGVPPEVTETLRSALIILARFKIASTSKDGNALYTETHIPMAEQQNKLYALCRLAQSRDGAITPIIMVDASSDDLAEAQRYVCDSLFAGSLHMFNAIQWEKQRPLPDDIYVLVPACQITDDSKRTDSEIYEAGTRTKHGGLYAKFSRRMAETLRNDLKPGGAPNMPPRLSAVARQASVQEDAGPFRLTSPGMPATSETGL